MIPRVEKVVDEIAFHRGRFEDFCRSLSEEELARPVPESEWTVKDYIAHLATIDQTVTRWFDALARGETPRRETTSHEAGHGFDIDTWNNRQVAKRSDSTVDELFSEAARHREKIVAVMERFTDEVIDGEIYFPGDKHRPPMNLKLEHYLLGWAKHDPIHVRDQLRALLERQADPVLVSWLEEAKIPSWPPQSA